MDMQCALPAPMLTRDAFLPLLIHNERHGAHHIIARPGLVRHRGNRLPAEPSTRHVSYIDRYRSSGVGGHDPDRRGHARRGRHTATVAWMRAASGPL